MSAMAVDPGPRGTSFRSVADMWRHRVGSTPGLVAMTHRVDGRWVDVSWRQADARARAIAAGLLAHDLAPEDRCALLATTSVSWILADTGILLAGGATTTIFPAEPAEACAYVLAHSGAAIVFCDTEAQVDKVLSRRDELPALRLIVVFEGRARPAHDVITLASLEAEGEAWAQAHPGALDAVADALVPDRLATLIYTSGTTGPPKGVELTHDAWIYEAEAIDRLGVVGPADRQLLFLPLAHVFAKVMQVAFVRLGIPTVVDGNPDRFLDTVQEVQPTWMAAVPRIFEKAYNRIVTEAHDAGPVQTALFRWAVDVGSRASETRRQGHVVGPLLAIQAALADQLVLRQVRERFGGRLRFLISGGAPLSVEIARFFDACGLLICEGYGLTESGAASCVNTPEDVVFGTVGRPLPGCEVRVADDGELLLRSRGVMRGYHDDEVASAQALDADGWLHTGDIGRILPSGHVQITDRKKAILVTANGKNIAPANVEQRVTTRSPLVAHALLHGDRRNFCTALLSLDPEALAAWAKREGLGELDHAALVARPEVREQIQAALDDVNRELPGYEQIRKFALVPEPFTVDNGLLTPSLKVRRRAVEARYTDVLEGFYEGTLSRLS
ncbi:MAG: long-chain fatty acid--CoA ligase [Alphaproteobacteria bacterium]|nr:long-chain fatty acid--CoA ligase [Alphaproteobacteria bacterium]